VSVKDVIISDLDGTIALDDHRAEKYLRKGGVRDWDGYYSAVEEDEPNMAVIDLLQTYGRRHVQIWIMSGRIERTRASTLKWLRKFEVPFTHLILRPDDCREQDTTMKVGWAREEGILPRTIFVLEDRARVVEAWRAAGVSCFQVAVGNF